MQRSTHTLLTSAAAVAAACLLLQPRAANGAGPSFVLLTAAEAKEWRTYPKDHVDDESPRSKGLGVAPLTDCHAAPAATNAANGPQINIVQPSLTSPLSAPIDIEVAFVAAGGAAIKPESFRVCYIASIFTKDITDRLTGHATVSADGIRVTGAQLPSGHHHLVLLIADEQGHTGRREASFEIK